MGARPQKKHGRGPAVTPLERLLQRWLDTTGTDQERGKLEATLRHQLDDPWLVARSPVLPSDEPLKHQAEAVCEALARVTRGETGEAVLAPLAEVPRRSPLAPYVLAIRAINALYAGDREQATRLARAVDEASPAAKLGRGVRVLAGEQMPTTSKALRRLVAVAGGRGTREDRLVQLDDAFNARDMSRAQQLLGAFIRDQAGTAPRLVRQVREEAVRRWAELGWPPQMLVPALALGRDQAESDRLAAIATGPIMPELGARFWYDFAGNAPLSPPERAMVLARAAELTMGDPRYCPSCGVVHTGRMEPRELLNRLEETAGMEDMPDDVRAFVDLLRAQMAEELEDEALDEEFEDEEFEDEEFEDEEPPLDPGRLLEEARSLDPQPDLFALRVKYLEQRGDSRALAAELERWTKAHPTDVRPLVRLAERASARGATRQAVAYIEQAEAADAMSPEVRLTRLRLLLNSALRRLQQQRVHLVRQDVEAMRGLEGTADQARRAVIAGLEALMAGLEAGGRSATVVPDPVAAVTGDVASAYLLLEALQQQSGLRLSLKSPIPTDRQEGARMMARGVLRFRVLNQALALPANGVAIHLTGILSRLERGGRLELLPDTLAELAAAAVDAGIVRLAMRLTDEALLEAGETALAPVLLQRGRALMTQRRDWRRAQGCLRAAFTLARQRGDEGTLRCTVQALRGFGPGGFHGGGPGPGGFGPGGVGPGGLGPGGFGPGGFGPGGFGPGGLGLLLMEQTLEPPTAAEIEETLRLERHEAVRAAAPGKRGGRKRGGQEKSPGG